MTIRDNCRCIVLLLISSASLGCSAIRIGVARSADGGSAQGAQSTQGGAGQTAGVAPAPPALNSADESKLQAFISPQRRKETAARLSAIVAQHAKLDRPDGFVYTVDLAQYMTYAVVTGDKATYTRLRAYAVNNLIRSDPSDPYTKDFVAWRYSEKSPADASGTTETLRLAEALWLGSQTFGDAAARPIVTRILHGYVRHEYVDQGVWLIRNYFNLRTRSFANNSFLVDYDPDLLNTVARATNDTLLARAARLSYDVVRKAATPAGLLYELIQPELLTSMPKLGSPYFSPNDWVHVGNSCTVAERSLMEAPERAHAIILFMRRNSDSPAGYYFGRTGEPIDKGEIALATAACIARLAHKVGDATTRDLYLREMIHEMDEVVRTNYKLDLFSAVEALTTLHDVEQPLGKVVAPGR